MSTETRADDVVTEAMAAHDNKATSGVDDRNIRITYVIIGCIGMLGNGFVVMVMLLRRKLLQRIANNYIFNQSAIDLAASLMMVMVSAPKINGRYEFSGATGSWLCKLVESNAVLFCFFLTSTYNMLALTAERYMQIVHPIRHKIAMTHNKAYATMAVTWVVCPAYIFAVTIPTSEVIDRKCRYTGVWPSLQVQQAVGIFHIFIAFFFPLLLISYFYGHMLRTIHRRTKVAPSGVVSGVNMNRAQRNLLKTVTLVTAFFVLCWAMNQFYFMLINCGYSFGFTSAFYHVTVIMAFFNSCVNPFIYILKYHEFQQAARSLFCKQGSHDQVSTATGSGIQTGQSTVGHATPQL